MKLQHQDNDDDFISPQELMKRAGSPFSKMSTRRQLMVGLAALSTAGFFNACSSSDFKEETSSATTDTSNNIDSGNSTCSVVPSETKGPYPLDGSNGTSALSGIYRSNILGSDIASLSGVPLALELTVQSVSNSCAPVSNAAVYVWHCDQSGQYSGYSSQQNGYNYGKTFCRGIVVTDNNGKASFTTLFPGWYAGRITHIHFAIYLNNNLSSATKVSQLTFPESITKAVYAVAPYSTKGQNTSVASIAADNIFSDGSSLQIASVSGTVNTGFSAKLSIGI